MKSKGPSPTQRSLALLRKAGIADVVERWIGGGKFRVRKDCFGFGDILACNPVNGAITLVQTTSGSNSAARKTKILECDLARVWLLSGGGIEVHSWRQRGKRGARKLWTCVITSITLADFPCAESVEEFNPD
jgi:hypothetical protein